MPPRKQQPKASILASLIDGPSEDDLGMTMTAPPTPPDSEEHPRRARGKKAASSSSTVAKKPLSSASSRSKPSSSSAAAAMKKRGRTALADMTNFDVDVPTDETSDTEPLRKRTKSKPQSSSTRHPEVLETILSVDSGSQAALVDSMVDESVLPEPVVEPLRQHRANSRHPPPTSSNHIPQQSRSRSGSRSRDILLSTSSRHQRAGSASSLDRIPLSASKHGDSATLRRKLGEATTKLEALQIKYSALRDLAGSDSQQGSFDKLKSATDARTRTQDSLIASLRREIQGLRSTDDSLRAKMAELQDEVERLRGENNDLREIKGENRILQGKVAALTAANARARSEEPTMASGASNVKGKQANGKGKAEDGGNAAAVFKLKEDLYCDLTGLMVHSVKKVDGEDVFDCIQTGRNGTLRFNLSMGDPANTSGGSYDDVEMVYTPILDERNDKHLLDILEDFLVEEICFPRNHAQGFYTKVRESMMRKVIIED